LSEGRTPRRVAEPRCLGRGSSGEGEARSAVSGDVVRRIDALYAAATGVGAAERVEVEPGDVVVRDAGLQAAAAGRARDRRAMTIANRERAAELGIGRVDHRTAFRSVGRRDGVHDAVAAWCPILTGL